MMECISDFSCWENTIARLAPIGTALIAFFAALIALGAIWAQMYLARRRASIDFFLKTEIDKVAIDLYDKFKEEAPKITSVPDPSDATRRHYDDVRSFLNICELIAVGVNKGAFSESVSFDYWGDVIPRSYRTAERLINDIRNNPEEGSQHTCADLEKLAKRWAKGTAGGSMRVRRGFFRLWLVLAVIWIAGGSWLLQDDLTGKLRPEELAEQARLNPPPPEGFVLDTTLENVHARRRYAFELVLLPPFGLLAIGCAGFWVARGFQS
jgi:hypothetical protein